jgi:hypothetical protein
MDVSAGLRRRKCSRGNRAVVLVVRYVFKGGAVARSVIDARLFHSSRSIGSAGRSRRLSRVDVVEALESDGGGGGRLIEGVTPI